ncbi:type VII secretion system-associated protein [Streptomyces canus]|uniref:type VII secretion system-associated protein n=1 Tax=Streptomyces canus TaxID=58343 RepID=UPI0033EBDE57
MSSWTKEAAPEPDTAGSPRAGDSGAVTQTDVENKGAGGGAVAPERGVDEGAVDPLGVVDESVEDEDLSGWAARLRAVPVDPKTGGAERPAAEAPELPEVPDDVREAARLVPDHWLGVVDPMWDDAQDPPAWAIVGQWRSDRDGEVVEWTDNPDYRPSPAMLGWGDPADVLDAAVQLAATGYGPAEDVTRVLAAAEVAVLVDAGDEPVTAAAPDGTAVVPVFSSEPHLTRMGALRHRVVAAAELVEGIPEGHRLYLNPAGPVGFVVDTAVLRDSIRETAE